MKDGLLYLKHIQECIRRIHDRRIHDYTAANEKKFRDSRLIQDAVLRNLQILAESTKRVSMALKKVNPEIDWRSIKGSRNILVHDYLGADLDVVWNIVSRDLPSLRAQIDRLIAERAPRPQRAKIGTKKKSVTGRRKRKPDKSKE